jgi:hypothetical protein
MPRHQSPTASLAASGALDRNANRNASRGSDLTPTGELRACPDFLNEFEQQCWREIVSDMPPGVLKNADNFAVENLSRLQAMIRTGQGTGAIYAQAMNALDRFGMNPKARPNVQVPIKAEGNPFT